MIMVTQKAKQHIKEMLAAKSCSPNIGMRLILKPSTGRFALKFDKERESDQVVRHHGSKVLLIDEKIVSSCSGLLTIDFGGTGAFPHFLIVRR